MPALFIASAACVLAALAVSAVDAFRRPGGVWQVTRDYVFHGEYASREEAAEGACNAARSLEAAGGAARVLATPGDTPIPHHTSRSKP